MNKSEKMREIGKATQFQPGNSGRPKGAKDKLRHDFMKALQEDFEENGVAAITSVRANSPVQYLKVIASVLPKEIEVTTNKLEELSDDELIAGIAALQRIIAESSGVGIPPKKGARLVN